MAAHKHALAHKRLKGAHTVSHSQWLMSASLEGPVINGVPKRRAPECEVPADTHRTDLGQMVFTKKKEKLFIGAHIPRLLEVNPRTCEFHTPLTFE